VGQEVKDQNQRYTRPQ